MPFTSAVTYFNEHDLDLDRYLQPHPISTYFMTMDGNSLQHIGIFSGDILVVDRSRMATNGNLIVAELNGELVARRLLIQGPQTILDTNNPYVPPHKLHADESFAVWGVITSIIRKFV